MTGLLIELKLLSPIELERGRRFLDRTGDDRVRSGVLDAVVFALDTWELHSGLCRRPSYTNSRHLQTHS